MVVWALCYNIFTVSDVIRLLRPYNWSDKNQGCFDTATFLLSYPFYLFIIQEIIAGILMVDQIPGLIWKEVSTKVGPSNNAIINGEKICKGAVPT